MTRPYETIEYGVQVSRDHLWNFRARGLRVLIDEKKFGSDYPALVWELGGFFEWLHLDAFVFFSLAPIPDGHVVHHRDENVRNARFENLELKTQAAHQTVHRLAKMKTQEKKYRLGSFWREHAKTALRPVSDETIAEIKKAKEEELRLATPRRLTRPEEEDNLMAALEVNFEKFLERAWPLGSKTRIPPTNKTKSFLDRDVRRDGVRPITRACSEAEAAYVYLLRLHRLSKKDFDREAALKELNSLRPKVLPEIHQATFDRMMGHPRVHEAMKNLRKYERLPVARKAWDPIKMKIRKKITEPPEEIIHSAVLEDAKAYAAKAASVTPATLSATALAAAVSSGFTGPLSRNVATTVPRSPGRLGSPRRSDPVRSECEHFWTESDLGIHDRHAYGV